LVIEKVSGRAFVRVVGWSSMVSCSVSASSRQLRSSSGVPQARVAWMLVVRVIWPRRSSRS
jgi:hypothetical protein